MAPPSGTQQRRDARPTSSSTLERLSALTKTAQFYWWVGHLVMLGFGGMYYLRRPFGWQAANWYYSKAYMGAIISYVIVIYKTYGPPQLSFTFLQRLMMDENVEYLMLAFYWLTQQAIWVSLLPFVVFSLFHVIGYARSTIIPVFFPGVPDEIRRASQQPQQQGLSAVAQLSKALGKWSSDYYIWALRHVGVWEVAVVGTWIVLGAVTFQTPLLAPFFYFHFLRLRYSFSSSTREAFGRVRRFLDGKLVSQAAETSGAQGVVADVYIKIRDYLSAMGTNMQSPAYQQQQQQQQQRQ
ncbi:Transmembrane nucleoporin [Coemansia sp. RSA 2607]|nr:Transmembrane nucleoporin [Coemansia sp. RSA 2607]